MSAAVKTNTQRAIATHHKLLKWVREQERKAKKRGL